MKSTLTQTAKTAWEEIFRQADEAAIHSPRVVHKMKIGQVVRQGDIYIHRIPPHHVRGHQTEVRQLVPGGSQGNRHVVDGPARIYTDPQPLPWAPTALLGPVVVADGRITITHPKHAHVSLPRGSYQITYQLDAYTLRRVVD